MDEQEFRKKCDAAMDSLRKRLLELGDELGFEVEGPGEKLEILFEEPEEVRFVISPNIAARQIWISALSTSFKLAWSFDFKTQFITQFEQPLAQAVHRGIALLTELLFVHNHFSRFRH